MTIWMKVMRKDLFKIYWDGWVKVLFIFENCSNIINVVVSQLVLSIWTILRDSVQHHFMSNQILCATNVQKQMFIFENCSNIINVVVSQLVLSIWTILRDSVQHHFMSNQILCATNVQKSENFKRSLVSTQGVIIML